MIQTTNNKKTNSGFTLIELLVTISIAAILLSIAVPSFTKMIKSNRITSATNELVASLILARSEALKRNDNVSLCASTDQTSCSGQDFSNGWIIFQDCNLNGVFEAGANNPNCVNNTEEAIIKVHDELQGISITEASNKTFLSYRFTGRSDTASLEIKETGTNTNTASKTIVINRTGRVKTE